MRLGVGYGRLPPCSQHHHHDLRLDNNALTSRISALFNIIKWLCLCFPLLQLDCFPPFPHSDLLGHTPTICSDGFTLRESRSEFLEMLPLKRSSLCLISAATEQARKAWICDSYLQIWNYHWLSDPPTIASKNQQCAQHTGLICPFVISVHWALFSQSTRRDWNGKSCETGRRKGCKGRLRGGRIILLIFFHRHHYFVVLGRHHSHPTIVRHLILFASPVLDLYLHSIIFITFPCSCPFSLSRTLFKVLSFDHISFFFVDMKHNSITCNF